MPSKVDRQRLKELAEKNKAGKVEQTGQGWAEPPDEFAKPVPAFSEIFDLKQSDNPPTRPLPPKQHKPKGPAQIPSPHPDGNRKRRDGLKRQMAKGRLPHGSEFKGVRYDGVTQTWSGMLLIPGCSEPFHGRERGVMLLLQRLDECYRGWLKRVKEKAEAESGTVTP